MDATALFGLTAAVLSGTFPLGQVAHIAKNRTVAGLSDTSWLLLTLTFATWLTWGTLQHDPYLTWTNAASLTGAIYVLWKIHHTTPIPAHRLAGAALCVTTAFATQKLAGTTGAIISVYTITALIRTRQQHTTKTATDLGGITLTPWAISTLAQTAWLAHGIGAHKPILIAHAPFAIATNIALMTTITKRRTQLDTSPTS